MYQRTLLEWERQKNRLDVQYGELLSRVDFLADEVRLYFLSQASTPNMKPVVDHPGKTTRDCPTLSFTRNSGVYGFDSWFQRGSTGGTRPASRIYEGLGPPEFKL